MLRYDIIMFHLLLLSSSFLGEAERGERGERDRLGDLFGDLLGDLKMNILSRVHLNVIATEFGTLD